MNLLSKWLTVPRDNATKQVDVVETWSVRWTSRHGKFFADTREEVEVFASEAEAYQFAEALRNAFKLIRHTSQAQVRMQSRQNGAR